MGICYGLQEIAYHYGGTVASCEHREYGHALVGIVDNLSGEGRVLIWWIESQHKKALDLFEGLESSFQVWMSHGDKLSALPKGFFDIGATKNAEHAAIASETSAMYGIQFHPESVLTPQGKEIIKNFLND